MITKLILCTLATWGAVEVINHGSVFEQSKAYLEAKDGFLGRLVNCPFCLSYWVAAYFSIVATFVISGLSIMTASDFLLLWFASVRLANFGNDMAYRIGRTPRDEKN